MIKLLIEKHIAVYTFAILIVIVGVLAYMNLPREQTPEIKQPWIFVTTIYPGVPPKDVETLITIPLEEELENISGVTKISSSSYMSASSIFVEFSSDNDTETALRRVKDRVDSVKGTLPDDAEDPTIKELNSNDWPIFIASFAHPDGVEVIDADVVALKDRLKRVKGVLDVSIAGNVEREVSVDLDPLLLQHFDLSLQDVQNAIRNENTSIPGGVMEGATRNFNLSVTGEIEDPFEFAEIMVPNGPVSVRLGDLGNVAFRESVQESYSRLNGSPSISLEVKKRTGSNLIELADDLKAEIEKTEFRDGTNVVYTYDESKFIKETISDLENNMFSGFVLVLLVTIFFLGYRNALFVSLAIPFSMLISFFILQLMGITLNMVVLFSLIIALGMLVDNGIVIVENIFRHATMGKNRKQAAIDGVKEVAGPIIASTITTCLAFFPIIFMPGIMGEFMKYLPITIIVVLVSSLFVALTINPVFCASFLRLSEKDRRKITGDSGDSNKKSLFMKIQDKYETVLAWTFKRPWLVVFASILIVSAGIVLYSFLGKEPMFFPQSDPGTAIIQIETRSGTPLEETDRIVKEIEALIPEIETPMESYRITVGRNGADESNRSTIRVEYLPFLDRDISGFTGTENIKKALKGKFPEAKITIEEPDEGPPSGHSVSYRIEGEDYGQMGIISEEILGILKSYPQLKEILSDYESPKPEVSVTVDRKKAAWFGVSTIQIASAVRNAFEGSTVGTFRYDSKEYDINVRYMKEYRNSVQNLKNLTVKGNEGMAVPLSSIADISYRSSAGVIKRKDLSRGVEVWADFKPDINNKSEILADIDRRVNELSKPKGYTIGAGEGVEVQDESTRFLIQAFIVALFLIMIVLIAQFGSFTDPGIIIFSVFLSMGGVFWGYALTGQTFIVIMSGIGCIALAGVAVNNCIVLVDYTNILMKNGTPWKQAIIESGKTRLRPVLLTAITTVLGMIPMAFGVSFDIHTFTPQIGSEQSEFWKAFAWAMIYGLSFATIMTLVVVPTFLYIKHRFIHRNQNKIIDEAGIIPDASKNTVPV